MNNWDTYERDFETLEFSVADQKGKEIIIRIVTHCVCDTIWHSALFLPWFIPVELIQASLVLAPVRVQ